ncbi:MAG TPA: PilN domain-containing protein [Fimbriimonadaceae bacterium]|nr:PilN domain-containing protein [Fimbriimonadaceae bacterium]
MPLINLIQETQTDSRQRARRARAFFLSFAGISLATVFGFGYLWIETDQAARDEESAKRKVARLEPMVKSIDANSKELGILSPRLATLEDAQVATDRWIKILGHLSVNTPEDIWLTNIRCVASDPTKPVTASFVGISTSQDSVANFLIRLQSSPDLVNVTLKQTQEKMVNSRKAIEFDISAELAGTAEAKPKVEGKEAA